MQVLQGSHGAAGGGLREGHRRFIVWLCGVIIRSSGQRIQNYTVKKFHPTGSVMEMFFRPSLFSSKPCLLCLDKHDDDNKNRADKSCIPDKNQNNVLINQGC